MMSALLRHVHIAHTWRRLHDIQLLGFNLGQHGDGIANQVMQIDFCVLCVCVRAQGAKI